MTVSRESSSSECLLFYVSLFRKVSHSDARRKDTHDRSYEASKPGYHPKYEFVSLDIMCSFVFRATALFSNVESYRNYVPERALDFVGEEHIGATGYNRSTDKVASCFAKLQELNTTAELADTNFGKFLQQIQAELARRDEIFARQIAAQMVGFCKYGSYSECSPVKMRDRHVTVKRTTFE